MSNAKVVMSQAANTLVKPLEVEDVFSTYLYDGTGAAQTITNGIDLDGEGGLVWFKKRNSATNSDHMLFDTERGANERLRSNTTDRAYTVTQHLNSFNSNGFTIGTDALISNSGDDFASWTFRKAPKFFDVVTYTGNNTANRQIAHNLDSTVGTIIVKDLDRSTKWAVYHRSLGATKYLSLNETSAATDMIWTWYDTEPTSTHFTVGDDSWVNSAGTNYVAYLFAHNDGDGGFNGGDIIKCGSYTGNGSTDGPEIDLGFEPQWVMVKGADIARGWVMADVMRGAPVGSNGQRLFANTSDAETAEDTVFEPTPTGFKIRGNSGTVNDNGLDYIYIAIRRGTKVPESATEVFAIDTAGGTSPTPPTFVSGFPVDFSFYKNVTDSSNNWGSQNRLTGDADLAFNTTSAEFSNGGTYWQKDYMNGIGSNTGTNSNGYQWMWKRAPGYFDAVAFSGDGVAGRTVSHNLGVAPEMMWVKRRNGSYGWVTYHSATTATQYLYLQSTQAAETTSVFWNDTEPTSGEFTVGSNATVNSSTDPYIAYLFASLAGVSKVFSVTKSSGSDASVDCGFTSGPRLVMLKRTDSTGDWYIWDTERGIVAGNDPYLLLNSTAAEVTSTDYIDPTSNGFTIVNGGLADGDYIGYAVA